MSSETLPNQGLPRVAIPSPNKYTPDFWVNKPHPSFGFLEVQARDGVHRGWLQFMPPQGFLIFGRDLGAAHIFVGHPSVSNQHAVAAWDVRDGKCYILDLESEHGTFVNDTVIEHSVPCELRPGARVRFGKSAHVYVFNKLPDELVDPNQEAPIIDRSMDTRTEASQPRFEERFPDRFEGRSDTRSDYDRPPPPFHGDRPPSDRDHRGPPPDMDRRGPPPPERWSPRNGRFDGRPPDGQGRGAPPDRYDDRGRFDQPRTPPHHMGGPRPPQRGGRSPRRGGPRSPRGGRRPNRGRGRPNDFH